MEQPPKTDAAVRTASRSAPAVRAAGRREAPAAPGGARIAILYLLLALSFLIVTGATFLLVADPANLIRDRLVAQVQLRTGGDLVVKGGASLTLFPSLGVVMRDVALSAPKEVDSSRPILRASTATAHVAWWPLIEGQVAVQSLALAQPTLDLVVDGAGRRNWDFALFEAERRTKPVRVAQLAPRFQHGQGLPPELYEALERSTGGKAEDLTRRSSGPLQDVSVSGGTVRYSDVRTGTTREITGLDLDIGLVGERRATISANGLWAGERVELKGELLRGNHPAKLTLRLSAGLLDATWEGSVATASASADLDGRIAARAPSGAALAAWMGVEPPQGLDGAFAIDGRLTSSNAMFELNDARIAWGGATATGSIAVEPMRQRPLVRADLKLPNLDLGRHLGAETGTAVDPRAGADDGRSAPAGSIGDLLRRTEDDGLPATPKAEVRGFIRRGDWSPEPISLAALQRVDIAAKLEVGRLVWQELRLEAARVSLTVDGGKMRAEVGEAELYSGRGSAVLTVHEEASTPVIGFSALLEDVAALPLMRDVAGFDWVEGRGRLKVALTTHGASEREMVQRLNGRADFKVTEGAVIGWNVSRMLRKLRRGQANAVGRDPEDKTPFSEVTGSFTVSDGIATNQDLKMDASGVELSGAGIIALPERAVDYTVRPKFAVAAERGSTAEPLSVEVPVRIEGAWAQPRLTADLQAVLNDPRTAETVQRLGRQLRSGNVDEAVKSIFGDGPEGEKKAEKAKELLQRFLKQ